MTAAEDIYLACRDKVSAYIRGKVDHHQDAEDLVSQVFEKVYGKLHTFDETKASLSTWIYTITRNTVTDYYRTRRIHASYDEAYELPAPEKDRDVLDTLADALLTLKERERHLILLHYYKGLTLKEVADKMGMSYTNAKVIHKKALGALKTYYQEDRPMESKKQFELNDDAMDAVSGGTASTSSKWSVGSQIDWDCCPCCGKEPVTGIVQELIYKRGVNTPSGMLVRFGCCGKSAVVSC